MTKDTRVYRIIILSHVSIYLIIHNKKMQCKCKNTSRFRFFSKLLYLYLINMFLFSAKSYISQVESETAGLCQRCHRYIGDKPFCYRCYGPQPSPSQSVKSKKRQYGWLGYTLIGACLTLMILSCFVMCIMHMFNIGIYKVSCYKF